MTTGASAPQRIAFACGITLLMSGLVFLPPLGLFLGVFGVLLALVLGWRTDGAAVAPGLLLGVPLGVALIGGILWWGNGHHVAWVAVLSGLVGLVVALLAYIAILLRRKPSAVVDG